MRKSLILLIFLYCGSVYASDYYLDILSVKGEPSKRLVVFSYRGCVDVLKVNMDDLVQENEMDEAHLKTKGPITKWLISQKKLRDGQKYDCKK